MFPDPILKLHTTRSWDFLAAEAEAKAPTSTWSSHKYHNISSDVIIGIIDTGILILRKILHLIIISNLNFYFILVLEDRTLHLKNFKKFKKS